MRVLATIALELTFLFFYILYFIFFLTKSSVPGLGVLR